MNRNTAQYIEANDHTVENTTVKEIFEASAAEVDSIFTSFGQLYEIYTESLSRLKKELTTATTIEQRKLENTKRAFEQIAKTVKEREIEISDQLYAQGIVLLVGNAESILRGMFSTLVLDNFRRLKVKKNTSISFTLQDIISAKSDEELGSLLLSKLEENGSPKEKLNFQNMKQLQGILKGYFDINIGDEYLIKPHKYTQIRHIIVHNQAFIDQQFIDNLKVVNIPTDDYPLADKITITRQNYKDCFAHLVVLFEQLDNEIERLKLSHIVP